MNKKDHEKHVKEVLKYLKTANLFFKSEKCEFHKKRVTFLGYVVISDGIEIDLNKIKTVQEW